MFNWIFKKAEQAIKFVTKPIIEETTYFFMGERWWIVGPMGGGKTTMHKFLEGNPTILHEYFSTPKYDSRKRAKSEFSSKFSKSTNAKNKVNVLKKKGLDYGGQKDFWKYWKTDIKQMHRFVFLYSLEFKNDYDLPHSLEVRNREIVFNPNAAGFSNIKEALKYTLETLKETYPKGKKGVFGKNYSKLLILCNKADLWFLGQLEFPKSKYFYIQAKKELIKIVKESKFEEETGFRIIFKFTTFNTSETRFEKLAFNNIHDILNDFIKDKK